MLCVHKCYDVQDRNYIEARGGNCLLVLWPARKSCMPK